MKTFAFAATILFLLSALAAVNYTAEYTAGNWLKVTRTIQVLDVEPCFASGVSNNCMNSGAVHPGGTQGGYATHVTLTIQNIGQIPRDGISIGESLTYIPSGAQLTFQPAPSTNDGRQVFWGIGSLKAGETKSVSYEFAATLSEGASSRVQNIAILSEPVLVSLSAPAASKVGDRISLLVKTTSGQSVPDAVVYIDYSDGSRQSVKTDSYGVATFTASHSGYYTYSIEGYRLTGMVSTNTAPLAESVPAVAAAAVADTNLLPSIAGIFPILAAIFIIAVIALILYNFLTSRKEDDDGHVPSQASASGGEGGAHAYTQKFSFAQEGEKEEKIRETTQSILESRKKQMREEQEKTQPKFTAPEEEETEAFAELDSQVVDLEAQAREGGESTHEEAEIEKTIAELETIREKLRARKSRASEEGETHVYTGEETDAEAQPREKQKAINISWSADEEGAEKPRQKKPSYEKKTTAIKVSSKPKIIRVVSKPRIIRVVSKPKKMKFATHGVKKR